MKKYLKYILIGIAIALLAAFVGYTVVRATASPDIKICHSTSSDSNPYVVQSPAKSGDVQGHDDHNGGIYPADPWGDIIPPFEYCPANDSAYGNWWFDKTCTKKIRGETKYAYPLQYSGKNWTKGGQAIWNNNCEIPVEPTPTPTNSPTPTPTETPTPTPTGEPEYYSVCREYSCVQVQGEGESTCKVDKDCEPEVTPTPSPEPTPTETPKQEERGLSPASAPVCNSPAVTTAPAYGWESCYRIDADTVHCGWRVTDGHAQSYGIYYGMSEDNLPWFTEVYGHETSSIDINLVPPGHVWTKICSIGTCGDQVCGAVVDP